MRMIHSEKKIAFVRSLMILAFLAAFLMIGLPAGSQEAEISITYDSPVVGENAFNQAMDGAETIFNDGLTTMNEATLRRAARQYEQIIEDFPRDPRHFNAYFSSAYIHMEYLQGVSDYEHTSNLLSLLINNHPSSYPEVTDAHVTLAHLQYRCLRDYRAAQENLSVVLNDNRLAVELGTREIDVKVLLAKCRQKLGNYDQALSLWEELSYTNPELDTEGRLMWIENSDDWFLIDDGTVRLFFEDGVERETYTSCLAQIRDGITAAENTWGLLPNGAIDVYLYASTDHLFDYTLRSNAFALPIDIEIHMAPSDMDGIPHLTGWLVSRRLNTRPDETNFPVLRAGFNHYFMGSRHEIDSIAAREIYYYGGTITDDVLLFPISYDYTFSNEYYAMSASFFHHLIDSSRVNVNDLEIFYRLLWANPKARMLPPLMEELSQLGMEGEVVGWQESLITPAQVYDLFRNVLGVDLGEEIASWQAGLSDEIALVSAELGNISTEIQRVSVDLSTPEKALESWWNAYKAGDFDAMIESSTREMGQFLTDARDYYREQDILDLVIMDHFIRPYRDARMVVVNTGSYADNIYAFEVRIEKDDEVEEKTIVVRMEGSDWKVDSN